MPPLGLCPERRPYCPRFDWSNFEHIILIDYTDFVRLTVKHPSQWPGDGGIVVYFLTPFRHRPKFGVLILCEDVLLRVYEAKAKPGAI